MLCTVCSAPSTQRCGRCKVEYYCSRDHQLKAWRDGHKQACGKQPAAVSLSSTPALPSSTRVNREALRLDSFFEPLIAKAPVRVTLTPGKGKGLFTCATFDIDECLYSEKVLVAGRADPSTELSSCGNCFAPVDPANCAAPCSECALAVYCGVACRATAWQRHKHLCEGFRFQGFRGPPARREAFTESVDAAERRHKMIAQVRHLGADCLCTTEVIVDVIARAESGTCTVPMEATSLWARCIHTHTHTTDASIMISFHPPQRASVWAHPSEGSSTPRAVR